MSHWIEKCENGHVLSQCRCIGPKTERIVPASECKVCLSKGLLGPKELPAKEKVPVGVAVLITRFGAPDSLLMIRRQGKHGAGKWCVPGGWVDPGEDPIEAAAREMYEETGLPASTNMLEYIGYTHDVHPEGIENICMWFVTKYPVLGEPQIMEPEKCSEMKWRSTQLLPDSEEWFVSFENGVEKGFLGEIRRVHGWSS